MNTAPQKALFIPSSSILWENISPIINTDVLMVFNAMTLPDALTAARQEDIAYLILPQDLNRPSWITMIREFKKSSPQTRVILLLQTPSQRVALAPGVDLILRFPEEVGQLNHLHQQTWPDLALPDDLNVARLAELLHRHQSLMEKLSANYSYISILQELTKNWAQIFHARLAACLTLNPNDCLIFTSDHGYQPPTDKIAESLNAYINQLIPNENVLQNPIMFHSRSCVMPNEKGSPSTIFFHLPVFSQRRLSCVILLALPPAMQPHQLESSNMSGIAHGLVNQVLRLDLIHQVSQRDPLTNLFNRRFAEKELERYFNLSKRYNISMALLFFDLDHFKQINDLYGHETGDKVLIKLADHLNSMLRKTDILCRLGGDEFIAILPYTNEEEAHITVERIYQALSKQDDAVVISLSTGVAIYHPYEDKITPDVLLNRADQAMFFAKRMGGNRHHFWKQRNVADDLSLLVEDFTVHEPQYGKPLVRIICADPLLARFITQVLIDVPAQIHFSPTVTSALQSFQLNNVRHQLFILDFTHNQTDMEPILNLPGAIHILLTTEFGLQEVIRDHGDHIFDLIQKPCSKEELLMAVHRGLDFISLTEKNEEYQHELVSMVNKRNAQVRKSLNRIKAAYEYTLDTMINMLDAREHETSQHSRRVRDLTFHLAQTMGIRPSDARDIAQGALFHDIGKIAIPDAILLKQSLLSEDEWRIMQNHPEIGYTFLCNHPLMSVPSEIVRSHHERYDGSGYPRHLKKDEICLGARLFAIIDSYDAIRSVRSYKKSVSTKDALAEIAAHRGTLFEPSVVDAFVDIIDEIEEIGQWDHLTPKTT